MTKLLPQESFDLREAQCAGAPVRLPEGIQGEAEGISRTPLSITSTIYIADIVVNGERPLICPHLQRQPDGDFCGAWIGVAKDYKDKTGTGERYTENDIPRCCHAFRIPSPASTT